MAGLGPSSMLAASSASPMGYSPLRPGAGSGGALGFYGPGNAEATNGAGGSSLQGGSGSVIESLRDAFLRATAPQRPMEPVAPYSIPVSAGGIAHAVLRQGWMPYTWCLSLHSIAAQLFASSRYVLYEHSRLQPASTPYPTSRLPRHPACRLVIPPWCPVLTYA